MNFLRKILFFNVVVVMVLHTLIPHKHHGEMTDEEHNITHNKANEIIDIIRLAFHQGSSNNLDYYTLSEPLSLSKIDFNGLDFFAGVIPIDFKLLPKNESPTSTISPYVIINPFIFHSNSLRGPPNKDFYS